MDTDLIQSLADLGGTLASLGFAGFLIIHLLKLQVSEREKWMEKDTESDKALQDLIGKTNDRSSKMEESVTLLTEVLRRFESKLDKI
jgi:hypothetical protein|tara:strand:+ start:210 stop:470 length:261 start_codon:yes stop_codon:yes gene_type:complete